MTQPTKHTPGPWVTDNYFDITSLRGDVIVRPPLSALEKARMHPGEAQANAHLIAAAPAMYEALQAMLQQYAWDHEKTAKNEGEHMLLSAVRMARSALAQANGSNTQNINQQHVCGAQGFGKSIADICTACKQAEGR